MPISCIRSKLNSCQNLQFFLALIPNIPHLLTSIDLYALLIQCMCVWVTAASTRQLKTQKQSRVVFSFYFICFNRFIAYRGQAESRLDPVGLHRSVLKQQCKM